jgi:RHS repeat-associated protein
MVCNLEKLASETSGTARTSSFSRPPKTHLSRRSLLAKTDPPSKNRVGGFQKNFSVRARIFPSQPVETVSETSAVFTETASGVLFYGYRYYFPELGRWLSRDPIGERGGLNVYGFIRNGSLFRMDMLGLEEVKESVFWRSPFLYQRDLGILLWGQYHMLITVSYDNTTGIISKVEIDNEFWDFWLGISAGLRSASALTWKAVREEPAILLNTASFSQTLFVGSDDFDELIHNIMIDVGFAAVDVKIPGAGRLGNWIAKKAFKKGVRTAVHALGKHDKPNTHVSTDFLFRTTCPDGETKYRLVKPYQRSNQLHKTRKMWFQENVMQVHLDMLQRDEFLVKDALKDAGWIDEDIQRYLYDMEKWNMYVQ